MESLEAELKMLDRAKQLVDFGRYEDALKVLKQPFSKLWDDPKRLLLFFICTLETNDLVNAKRVMEKSLEQCANISIFHHLASHYYEAVNDMAGAFKHAKIALEIDPEAVENYSRMASLQVQVENFDEASRLASIGASIDPNDITLLRINATIQFIKEKRLEALSFANRALELDPNDSKTLALRSRIIASGKKDMQEAEESAFAALAANPNDDFARETVIGIKRNSNGFFRFFVGNAFSRYRINWTGRNIIIFILFWKGTIVWAGFGILYMMVTWYGGVLYNSVLRLDKKLKYLLNRHQIMQSNVFLGFNLVLLIGILTHMAADFSGEVLFALIASTLTALLIAISFFEIKTSGGKKQFYWCVGLGILLTSLAINTPLIFGILCTLGLLIYGVMFTLQILFK